MDLSVNFLGIPLKNPIIVSAGPLTSNGEMMKRAVHAGAGAVVTKTIANEIRPNVRPRLHMSKEGLNIELYSDFSLEVEHEIAYAKSMARDHIYWGIHPPRSLISPIKWRDSVLMPLSWGFLSPWEDWKGCL